MLTLSSLFHRTEQCDPRDWGLHSFPSGQRWLSLAQAGTPTSQNGCAKIPGLCQSEEPCKVSQGKMMSQRCPIILWGNPHPRLRHRGAGYPQSIPSELSGSLDWGWRSRDSMQIQQSQPTVTQPKICTSSAIVLGIPYPLLQEYLNQKHFLFLISKKNGAKVQHTCFTIKAD